MRKVVLIPTYWSREKKYGWQEGDAVYDHPTPLDEDGTLGRTLESMKILTYKDFKLVLLICPTAPEIAERAEKRVIEIVKNVGLSAETYIFTLSDLQELTKIMLAGKLQEHATALLSMSGYANVRNMCLLCADILSAEAAILIDDDEVFEKADFIERAVEFLGKRIYGDVVYGMAGYYLNKNDQYYDDVQREAWMTYWDRFGAKAKAFDEIIGRAPRIKRTPFAFGGAMVLHRDMFTCVPFDPMVTRGEDIDYLINSKMYGFNFFLDNTLSIKHLPVQKKHPLWKRIREDIYRFVYEKEKISSQYKTGHMVMVYPEDFDPYPGEFLRDDLDDKIFRSNMMLAAQYMQSGDVEGSNEALNNIAISRGDAKPKFDAFSRYRVNQKLWEQITDQVVKNRYELRKVLEKHNLSSAPIIRNSKRVRKLTQSAIAATLRTAFNFEITKSEWDLVKDMFFVKTFYENEIVFSSGDFNDSMYVLLKGEIVIFGESEVARLHKGDVLGESCLTQTPFSLNCRAEQFTEMLGIKIDDLRRIVDEDPALGIKMYREVVKKVVLKLRNSNILLAELSNPAVSGTFFEE